SVATRRGPRDLPDHRRRAESTGLIMRQTAGSLANDDLLHTFQAVLKHALRHGELPPTCLAFNLAVVQAVGDVARAARDSSPTRELVAEARRAFAKCAAEQKAVQRSKLPL
ncbi:MAG TPA: hypothetical protein VIO95_11360, partial [Mycobacterium sp.]